MPTDRASLQLIKHTKLSTGGGGIYVVESDSHGSHPWTIIYDRIVEQKLFYDSVYSARTNTKISGR